MPIDKVIDIFPQTRANIGYVPHNYRDGVACLEN